jgi:dTDP-4-dehydrorhamnose reductase
MGGVRTGRGGSFEDCARSRRARIVAALNRNSSVGTSTMLVTGAPDSSDARSPAPSSPSPARDARRATDGDAPVILVTGADGQVGWEVRRALAPLGRVIAVRRADVDVADGEALRALVRRVRPSVIVNAAAYTAVDRAESEREVAFAVNAEAPRALAEEAARSGALLVHFSTDYVFDGTKPTAYTEEDEPAPLGAYGESKLAGDRAIIASGAAHLIFRTSWVYAPRGRNFMLTMLRLARERETLRVVSDQRGVPTSARLIATATAAALGQRADESGFSLAGDRSGVYNLTARGVATWYDFAHRILALDPRPGEQRCRELVAITTAEYPTPARRPASSVLDVGKVERTFGLRMPEWEAELERVMEEVGDR